MYRIKRTGFLLLLVLLLTACGKSAEEKWQEQYDLGMKYLEELDYEQAIVAFAKAIDLEPKEIRAYTGLIAAYMGEENMETAEITVAAGTELFVTADTSVTDNDLYDFLSCAIYYYEENSGALDTCAYWSTVMDNLERKNDELIFLQEIVSRILEDCLNEADMYLEANEIEQSIYILNAAIELYPSEAESYEKLANAYISLKEWDEAIEVLRQGYEKTGDEVLREMLTGLNMPSGDTLVEWDDPALENMIRQGIGIIEGDIYVKDLDNISTLEILGNTHIYVNDTVDYWYRKVAANDNNVGVLEAYYGIGTDGTGYTERGKIVSIQALWYFRNLSEISIIANHVEDISVLQDRDLAYINFFANDIADISLVEEINGDSGTHQDQFIEIGSLIPISY